jgi:tRNA (adenine22-N1)-methyltransferase
MLSHRLETALSYAEGAVLADIGTDHAYLPIAACLRGLAERAVACDINAGPLKTAKANIREHELERRIETRIGDGLAPLSIGEADCIVIAGMGGMRIIEILTAGHDVARSAKRLVLQPQHDIPRLRRWLHENYYTINAEAFIKDGGKYYTVISAAFSNKKEEWSGLEYHYGRHILNNGGDVFKEFLNKEAANLAEYMKSGGNPSLIKRYRLNREARQYVNLTQM